MIRTFIIIFHLIMFNRVQAQQPRLVIPLGHTEAITIAVFSPDGKKIATGSDDRSVKLWDVETGRLLTELKGHTGGIKTVAFNRSGDRLLTTASLDSTARLWNAGTGQLVKEITPSRYSFDFAKFSPDGNFFVLHHSRKLFFSETGEEQIELAGYGSIDDAKFSEDGNRLFCAEGSKLKSYDLLSGKAVGKFEGDDPIALVPGKDRLLASSYDKSLIVYDIQSGDTVHVLANLPEKPYQLYVSPAGDRAVLYFISAGTFELWDIENGKKVGNLGMGYSSTEVRFNENGGTVYISPGDFAETTAWNTRTGEKLSFQGSLKALFGDKPEMVLNTQDGRSSLNGSVILDDHRISLASFAKDGNRLFITSGKNSSSIWNVKTGRLQSSLRAYSQTIEEVIADLDRNFIAVRTGTGANLLSMQEGLLQPVETALNQKMGYYFLSPDSKYAVTVTASGDYSEKVGIWDLVKSVAVKENIHIKGMQNITLVNYGSHIFSEDGSRFFISNNDWGSYIFETATGNLLREIRHERLWFTTIDPSFKRMIQQKAPATYEEKPVVKIIDISSGTVLNELNISPMGWEKFRFVRSNSNFLVYDDQILLYAEKGKKPLARIPNGTNEFNKTQTHILVNIIDTLGVWDLATGRPSFLVTRDMFTSGFRAAAWTPDQQHIIYSQLNGAIEVCDLQGKVVHSIEAKARKFVRSEDGDHIFAIEENSVNIIDAKTWQIVSTLTGHENTVKYVYRIPGRQQILTIGDDNTARTWDLASGNLIYTHLLVDRNLQMTYLPSGHYMANATASRNLHFVTPGLRVISFDQLDVTYNRPDLVMKQVSPGNAEMISSYYKAWQKRLKKLGIDSTRLQSATSLPSGSIVNAQELNSTQATDRLTLKLRAGDERSGLKSFNIWVNEVPLYGQKGHLFKGKLRNEFDSTVTIRLGPDENLVEFSVTNHDGSESYRMPLEVKCDLAGEEPVTHFIGIGVDKFRDNRYDLLYSTKDIRDLAELLKQKFGDKVKVDTLLNESFTPANLATLKKKLMTTGVNDRVILAYSGHGLLSDEFDYYLSAPTTNFEKPQERGIPYESLEVLLDSIPARKKLFLIDACHSGEVDKEELERIDSLGRSLVKGLKPVAYKQEGQVGLKNSFELMQSLFVNVSKSTGSTVISAAAGTQFALEKNELANGVFTFTILELLKQREHMKVSELKAIVSKRVVELTNGLQRPTSRSENLLIDWEVW